MRQLTLPSGDIRLGTGQVLHRKGHHSTPLERGYWWQTDDGLNVLATLNVLLRNDQVLPPHEEGLHVSLSYPQHLPPPEVIEAVQHAFFGDVEVVVLPPGQGSPQPYVVRLIQREYVEAFRGIVD